LESGTWVAPQDSDSKEQVGSLSDFENGEIRAFPFGLVGTLNFKRPWVYTLLANTNVRRYGSAVGGRFHDVQPGSLRA
jgi:hypothetical protein